MADVSRPERGMPCFIGGARSGTTYLINLLGLHPEIVPWFETKELCEALRLLRVLRVPEALGFEAGFVRPARPVGFAPEAVAARMRQLARGTFRRLRGQAPSGKAPYERYPLGHDCVLYDLELAEEAIEVWRSQVAQADSPSGVASAATGRLIAVLGERQRRLSGGDFWVNKTPEITRFGFELAQCLGTVRLILLVRDCRQVALSAKRLGQPDVARVADLWTRLITETRSGAAETGHPYREVRYEDLTRDPAAVLDEMCSFLGTERLGSAMVEEYRERIVRLTSTPSAERLQEALSAEERSSVEERAGPLMRELGYLA